VVTYGKEQNLKWTAGSENVLRCLVGSVKI
jgi:hypothetical protein